MSIENIGNIVPNEVGNLEKLLKPHADIDMDEINEAVENIISNGGDNVEMKKDAPTVPPIASHPTYEPIPGTGLSKVTDIFGNTRICDPNTVDIFSGLPPSFPEEPSSETTIGSETSEPAEIEIKDKLTRQVEKAEPHIAARDAAVEHYKDAKSRGNYEEMAKWEAVANKEQGMIDALLPSTTYGINQKAPGIS